MGHRVRERLDHLLELDDRARPAVGHDQRRRARFRRLHVDEVDAESVQVRLELGESIQLRLATAPVVFLLPILGDFLQLGERDALLPVVDGLLVRPSRVREAALEVDDLRVGDLDLEGLDLAHAGGSLFDARGRREARPIRAASDP